MQGSYDSGKSGKTWKKTFYSGKTWKTQGKIWILRDLREEIFSLASEKTLGDTFCVFAHNIIYLHIFYSYAFLLHLT